MLRKSRSGSRPESSYGHSASGVADEGLGPYSVAIGRHGATRKVTPNGRHGRDFKYVARVKVDRPLTVGTKYTVRFTFGDDRPVARKVLLRAAR